ncbi:DUF3710 domain-containing protein [Micromonospora sp. ALFpr18c]|uniref:DUF3710 domain-containing protein n=1 Tax=unclassified Micromonospora TaxID=2617518 RepID=UPI00124B2539|nr:MULTISPECIES: DUF3710 domain-containing protein [unclassified Micromonospora]KAB1939575.1 DUF3710 domain-containing protein [Micromonospora sp. ALFpr18c]MDG4759368.1 DUF3710 domain-containing protein [Micromonospora sp. WMMD710]
MIFSRKRAGAGRQTRDERTTEVLDQGAEGSASALVRGPYDISEVDDDVQRLDLGSLHIPAIAEVEVRVQADPQGVVQQVVLVHGDNALQLGVFAAPRSEGIWDEVREEIRQSLLRDGAAAQEVEGEYGPELHAQVRTPDGPTNLRFVGVDGPRWMVRGVFQGPVATDPATAGPLAECLDGLVVDRGQEAKPVREPLPLRLPREIADQAGAEDGSAPAAEPRQV